LAQQTANKRISIKSITFASVLTFVTLGGMVEEAKAYLYCELKGGSQKKNGAVRSVHLTPFVA
jgi:hypothetical protein